MRTFLVWITCTCALLMAGSTAYAAQKYLFYIHGAKVKDANDPKVKQYEAIITELKKSGFNVSFELRPADVGDNNTAVQDYAAKIAGKVKHLLDAGTPPANITVAGFSLGSTTTAVIAGLVNNPKVNFVFLAGCANKPAVPVTVDYSRVKGRILAIIEASDDHYGTCIGRLPEGITYHEVKLNSGKGHETFRLTELIPLWKDPMVEWTKIQ